MGLIGVLGLMAACSKEEVSEQVGEAITFSGSMEESGEVTRAETALETLTHSFKVWAFKNKSVNEANYSNPECVFPGYNVNWAENSAHTSTTNSDGWEYVGVGGTEDQTIKYWDLAAKAYKFFGYAPATADVKVEFYKPNGANEANGTYETYEANGIQAANWANEDWVNYSKCRITIEADASTEDTQAETPYLSRLWFAPGSDLTTRFSQPVKLEFFKPFAQVRFMFKLSKPDEPVQIELPHFFPSNPDHQIVLCGTVKITYSLTGTETKEVWESTENPTYSMAAFTQEWYKLTDAEVTAAQTAGNTELIANQEKWYTVLPIRDQGAYTLTVRVNGEERTCYVPGEYMNWLPGYSYTYLFKVNEDGGIEIDAINVAFTDWQGNDEKEKKVYNW